MSMMKSESILNTNFAPKSGFLLKMLSSSIEGDMTADQFLRYLADYELPRKEFCSAFGIGESTLSGWLKADRIPATVPAIFDLIEIHGIQSEMLRRMAMELDNAESDSRLIKEGDTYSIVSFSTEQVGEEAQDCNDHAVGEVVARDIPDLETGCKLIAFHSMKRTFAKVEEFLGKSQNDESKNSKWTYGYEYNKELLFEIQQELAEFVDKPASPDQKE